LPASLLGDSCDSRTLHHTHAFSNTNLLRFICFCLPAGGASSLLGDSYDSLALHHAHALPTNNFLSLTLPACL
jgi:hypothetical protein